MDKKNSENKNQTKYSKNPIRLRLHIPVPWVFVLAYLVSVVLQIFFPFGPYSPTMLIVSISLGIVLFVTGAAFAGWSLFIFHKARTTTVPGEASAQMVTWGAISSQPQPNVFGPHPGISRRGRLTHTNLANPSPAFYTRLH
jgi:hypothetical protein